ncbi:MAG: hypothetical protein ACOYJJ_05920 [Anaerovoracaceae bacterium]|jgi:anti-sigma-K factor RskA
MLRTMERTIVITLSLALLLAVPAQTAFAEESEETPETYTVQLVGNGGNGADLTSYDAGTAK